MNKKEYKITVKHSLATRLKPKIIDGEKIYSHYTQLTYRGNVTRFRSYASLRANDIYFNNLSTAPKYVYDVLDAEVRAFELVVKYFSDEPEFKLRGIAYWSHLFVLGLEEEIVYSNYELFTDIINNSKLADENVVKLLNLMLEEDPVAASYLIKRAFPEIREVINKNKELCFKYDFHCKLYEFFNLSYIDMTIIPFYTFADWYFGELSSKFKTFFLSTTEYSESDYIDLITKRQFSKKNIGGFIQGAVSDYPFLQKMPEIKTFV